MVPTTSVLQVMKILHTLAKMKLLQTEVVFTSALFRRFTIAKNACTMLIVMWHHQCLFPCVFQFACCSCCSFAHVHECCRGYVLSSTCSPLHLRQAQEIRKERSDAHFDRCLCTANSAGVRVVVAALFTSIPALGSVLVVAALFYYIAGVLTMSLLIGNLYK